MTVFNRNRSPVLNVIGIYHIAEVRLVRFKNRPGSDGPVIADDAGRQMNIADGIDFTLDGYHTAFTDRYRSVQDTVGPVCRRVVGRIKKTIHENFSGCHRREGSHIHHPLGTDNKPMRIGKKDIAPDLAVLD